MWLHREVNFGNRDKQAAKSQTCSTAWQNLRNRLPRWRPHDVTTYPRPPTHPQPDTNSALTVGLQIPPRQDVPFNFLQVTHLRLEITVFINYSTKWIADVDHLIIEINNNQLNSGYADSPIHVSSSFISPSSFPLHITLFFYIIVF